LQVRCSYSSTSTYCKNSCQLIKPYKKEWFSCQNSSRLMAPKAAFAVGTYSNAEIANKALTYVGQWGGNACFDAQKPGDSGGQCRAFVNCIVWMASNHSQALGGSDYFSDFVREGSQEITETSALAKGDIVQVGQGEHTFIIVSKVSGNTFSVVDSNHDFHETVMNYNRTLSLDSNTRAFRMGSIDGSGGNAGTLWFIKTKNTGSGHVEVHSATLDSGYQGGQHSVTWFCPAKPTMVGSRWLVLTCGS
jgi:hypothetical protein